LKKVLFLGCNESQMDYLKALKDDDWHVVGTDLNLYAPGKNVCDKFYNCGYDSINELIAIGRKEGFTKTDKVFTASAQFAHLGASLFAEEFSIPYASRKTIEICLNKTQFYKYFSSLNIPIPNTYYINDEHELNKKLKSNQSKWYWLKSDFSKNPNYVYRFHSQAIPYDSINWKKDRYFKEKYILQPEHHGISLRINIYGSRFNVFDFESGKLTHKHHSEIENLKIIDSLRKIMESLNLKNWLVKFDIILEEQNFVVLDIGLEPPFRMRNESVRQGIRFEKYYIKQYLYGKIEYPDSLD